MPSILALVFKWSIGIVGVLLIYATLSYEDEDGKIQNLLEDWWVKVDDLKKRALAWHIAFIKTLASVVTGVFDRSFGKRILSVESLGVSICYLYVLVGILSLFWISLATTPPVRLIAFGLLYARIPILLRRVKRRVWKLTPTHLWFITLIAIQGWGNWGTFFSSFYLLSFVEHRGKAIPAIGVTVTIFLAEVFFWITLGLMRYSVRTIVKSESALAIVGLLAVNLGPLFFFITQRPLEFTMPVLAGEMGIYIVLLTVLFLVLIVPISFAFVVVGTFFVVLAITMLLHRLFWPAIDRPLYKLQALGISKRPKVFATIGLLLVGIGFGKAEWLKSLLDKLL
jgi:hypothetical protein